MEKEIKTGIKEFHVYCEDERYFGSLRMIIEETDGYHEYIIPKIDLNITKDRSLITIVEETDSLFIGENSYKMLPAVCGYTMINSYERFNNVHGAGIRRHSDRRPEPIISTFYDRLIKEKVHKMTKEEIEKELGYKIEIISE